MKVNQYCVILQIFHQENLAGIIFHAFTISYKSIFHMLCMARWLADYTNPTKREVTSPIATILIETIKRWRENVKKGVKNKFVCLGFMRSGMKRFLMWRSIHLSDLDGVNTNNLGFEHVNKVFTPLLFKRTKGKHPWKNQGSSFHLTKCSKDLQNAKIVRGLKSTINKVKKGHSQITWCAS